MIKYKINFKFVINIYLFNDFFEGEELIIESAFWKKKKYNLRISEHAIQICGQNLLAKQTADT